MNQQLKVLTTAKERRQPLGFSLGTYLRSMDWILAGATLALVAYGLLMLYSATHADTNISTPFYYVRQQAVGLVIGIVVAVVLSVANYRWLARRQVYIYAVTLLLLLLTLVIGHGSETVGANRWIQLPYFRLQTSELAKLLLIVSLGAVLAEGVELRHRFRFVILCVLYLLIPSALVFLQPDLGTMLVFFAILVVMLVVWGIRMTHLGILAGAAALVSVVVLRLVPAVFGVHLLKEYQLQRLTLFLNPEKDPTRWGYQLSQSKIAIGSGMFTGKGYLNGTQTQLNFLPAHHTDFIFAVIGEELGFMGAVLLLGLFAVIIWRAFRIVRMSDDMYGSLIAAGIAGVLVFQVFVNVGMTIGIMPVTGIPLPFVSFGSSSLVVFLMAIGLLESVHVHSVAGRPKGP
ncbi:MAG: rod shape-determining protein RodA [Actinobacteria bacterium]|nr:rod shape-determining protein RodA [Actinomycetota bacterium]